MLVGITHQPIICNNSCELSRHHASISPKLDKQYLDVLSTWVHLTANLSENVILASQDSQPCGGDRHRRGLKLFSTFYR